MKLPDLIIMSTILNGSFRYKEGDKKCVVCVQCAKEFKYHHSTSSLSYHLKNSHGTSTHSADKTTDGEEKSAGKKLFQSTLDQCSTFSKMTQAKEANITTALALWIARDSRPISISQDSGLTNLLRVATNHTPYNTPSRSTIQKRVDKLFVELRDDVESSLGCAESIALTCDYWTSTANENYLGLTAHYVNKKTFKLAYKVLDVS